MSIIIVAQSLKNDGTADIQIDGEFSPPPEKLRLLNTFDKNGSSVKFKKFGNCGIEFGIVPGLLPINSIYCFTVNCEEKDNMSRISPIGIQARLTEIQNIIPHLETFLKKSSRTISPEKMKNLKGKINFERNTIRALIRAAFTQIPVIRGIK